MVHPLSGAFPKDWPPCCPPADAVDAHGTVYRVVKSDPLRADSFETAVDKGPFIDADPCKRVGISVNQDLKDALHQKEAYPQLGSLIAKAQLAADHGKIKPTPRKRNMSHLTWWKFETVDCTAVFTCIDEDD